MKHTSTPNIKFVPKQMKSYGECLRLPKPKSRYNNSPKLPKIAQRAIILHTLGVQVGVGSVEYSGEGVSRGSEAYQGGRGLGAVYAHITLCVEFLASGAQEV